MVWAKGDPLNAFGWSAGLAVALLAQVGAQAQESASGGIYTCVDASGRRLTSDRPITACIDREQRELGPTGNVRRVIGPSLTEHEKAAQAAQLRKEQDERTRIADERRRERVLLARYPNRSAHDTERAAALEMVDSVTAVALKRIDELKEARKGLDAEMEFYKKDPLKAPMKLQRQIASNEADIEEQQRFIAGQGQEKQRIHKRFDAELAQLQRLWAARAPIPVAVPGEAR
ncbi:MAG: DUF4124 domain-containing protein [Acidovorax sp. SCN 68-22]|jgi:hypothetical protein|nr:DUF4124 domain-containing protein [Simplicispira sp.]ODS70772.1 MAG: DUF4124 domain-containing protein [Acidovorax sp. SCN 68-22]